MKKILIVISLLLLSMSVVSAITFPEDTTFSNGDIDFTFTESIDIEDFKLINEGIIVDDFRIVIVPEGGKLEIVFLEWNETKKISVTSDVKQTLTFKITENGVKYYAYTGSEYAVDKYEIGKETVEWSFKIFDEDREIDNVVTLITDNNWWNTVVFFFEVPELSTGATEIGGKVVMITYKTTVISIGIVALLMIVVFWRRKN